MSRPCCASAATTRIARATSIVCDCLSASVRASAAPSCVIRVLTSVVPLRATAAPAGMPGVVGSCVAPVVGFEVPPEPPAEGDDDGTVAVPFDEPPDIASTALMPTATATTAASAAPAMDPTRRAVRPPIRRVLHCGHRLVPTGSGRWQLG